MLIQRHQERTSAGLFFMLEMISYQPLSTKIFFAPVRLARLIYIPSIFLHLSDLNDVQGGLAGSILIELHDSFSLLLGETEGPKPKLSNLCIEQIEFTFLERQAGQHSQDRKEKCHRQTKKESSQEPHVSLTGF